MEPPPKKNPATVGEKLTVEEVVLYGKVGKATPVQVKKPKQAVDEEDPYELLKKLGEGTYGAVYHARCKATGEEVALKEMNTTKGFGISPVHLREITLLSALKQCPNVVQMHTYFILPTKVRIIMEMMPRDLDTYVTTPGSPMPLALTQSYMKQLLAGLDFCHVEGILHRDIKPGNLLIDRQGKIKLADFGLAKQCCLNKPKHTPNVVSLQYQAPELCFETPYYGPGIDVWALGVVHAFMLTKGGVLFFGDTPMRLLIGMAEVKGPITPAEWPQVEKIERYHEYKRTRPIAEFVQNAELGVSETVRGLVAECNPQAGDLSADLQILEMMLTYDPAARPSVNELGVMYQDLLQTQRRQQAK
eukprot:m.55653 g.55653  ORF g.55653 m.55653 type:complete len:360 (-) comp11503_c0_seq2:343-1422(-)